MAYILGKNLDKWDESVITTAPFSMPESEANGPKFMTGKDLLRSIKISPEWKTPVAIYSQAYKKLFPTDQAAESFISAGADAVRNFVPNLANAFAQRAVEIAGEGEKKPKTIEEKLYEGTDIGQIHKALENAAALGILIPGAIQTANEIKEKAQTADEAIELLNGREYPISRYAQRIIAETTRTAENRKLVRELFNQAHGIDAEKWYNQGATILGAMTPAILAGRLGYKGAILSGASRAAAANVGRAILQGYTSAEMAGQYAEETAAQYLRRTGDMNFENFSAKDASGLSSLVYGGIAGWIETMGGVEAITAGALNKVGLRAGVKKAAAKIAAGEAGEELLQGGLEILMRKMEGTTDKTWGQGFKEALVGAMWGALIGGTVGTTAFYVNRSNLIKGIRQAFPKMTDTQAMQVADAMIDSVGDTVTHDPTLRDNLRKKVSFMLKNTDIDNKEDTIDAITDLEYAMIAMDATDRGIRIADHELFQGEMTSIGWFREGIPEAQRTEIQKVIDNITDLQTQLETLNKAKEKDWAKIEEIENKLASAEKFIANKISDIGSEIEMLGERYTRSQQESFKKKLRRDNKVKIDKIASTLREKGLEVSIKQSKNKTEPYSSEDTSSYIEVTSPLGKHVFRLSYETNGARRHHKTVDTSYYAELDIDTIVNDIMDRIKKPAQLKEELRYVGKPEVNQYQPLFSPKTTIFKATKNGKKADFKFGAYIPGYRFILRANQMNAAGLSKMLAHDWMETNFTRYREGKMSKDFMRAWGALEKALGIPENATSVPRKASEAFARAYEGWIVQNEDWAKFINVEDKDKADIEKLMKDYQGELRDIYNDISNPYFINTWGKLGELKPELKAWFDRVVNITDLDVMVERGEMTEEQAATEKLNRAIDTVIETTKDEETKQSLKEFKTLNDTKRYEVEGGNTNSIQRRLSNLAKDIDENNMITKGDKYDTRRDMLQVAEAADNFVKTRRDEALAIINGEMAETEGLFKEDLYTALERLAVETGDLDLIDELKSSEVANTLAKELGQRVAGFRNFKPSTDLDVVSAVKSLDNKFGEVLKNKKAKQKLESALAVLDESIKKQDKVADKELDSFLKDLECK